MQYVLFPSYSNTFGSSLNTRSFSAGSGFRFGFNGKENFDNYQDYGFRIYYPSLGKFLSVDPLTKVYPWFSSFHFAGNTPIQAIDLEGAEPKSVVSEKYRTNLPWSLPPSGDDPEGTEEISGSIVIVTYKFTKGSTHLLSLVSGIAKGEISRAEIRVNGGGILPTYDPNTGGGGITFPGKNNTYRINLTANYFDKLNNKFGDYGYQDNVIAWLDMMSHEIGHVEDIQEIGKDKVGYFMQFAKEYAKAGSHANSWREKRAEIGRTTFRSFNSFVNSYYGQDKLKALFENKNNSDKDIVERLDQWWRQYQKKIETDTKVEETKKE